MTEEQQEDLDAIDYSTAFRRESQRRHNSEEILKIKTNADLHQRSQKVRNGFVNETMAHEGISNNDLVFDVLPSFEMYRSLQCTTNYDSNINPDHHELPPDYFTGQSSSTTSSCFSGNVTPSLSLTGQPTSSSTTTSVSGGNQYNYEYDGPSSDQDLIDKNIVDIAHRLPRYSTNEVFIEIHVTKDVPVPYSKSEAESMLKEYTSGDVVHGYVTIHNRTSKPLPFLGFYVTLEGSISIVDPINKKQTLKKFLNMMDLSASWSYGCISPSANLSYTPGSKDYDGAFLGLSNDRILQPNSKYRKFFTFKFPYNCLDTTCRHQQELHTLLPPSFGLNKIKKKGKYAHLEVNPLLGYGHNGKRGSPIITRDLSNDNLSVDYSINAFMVGNSKKNSNVDGKLMVMAEEEYSLRFIPFGFGVSLFSSQRSLEFLKKLIEDSFKNAERSLKLIKEGKTDGELNSLDLDQKMRQLRICDNDSIDSSSDKKKDTFPLRNDKHATPDFSKVETSMVYIANSKKSLLSKFKGLDSQSSNGNGFITITTSLPKDGLPYISPSLIKKTNEISKLNSLGYENYNLMSSTLSTNEKKKLTSLKFNLKFQPSDHHIFGNAGSLPDFKLGLKARLLVMNVYSSSSIPIKLSSDIFMDCNDYLFKKLQSEFTKYDTKYQQLCKDFEQDGLDIKKYIPWEISRDMQTMKDLKSDTYLLPVFNHKIINSSNWSKSSSTSSSSETPLYEKTIELNLEFKDQIQETLIPTFQNCLMSRIYCIQIDFSFDGNSSSSNSTSLRIPIRLRQFDGN